MLSSFHRFVFISQMDTLLSRVNAIAFGHGCTTENLYLKSEIDAGYELITYNKQ